MKPVSAQVVLTGADVPKATGGCFSLRGSHLIPGVAGQCRRGRVGPHRAVNPFALGDTYALEAWEEPGQWDTRYAILNAIYRSHFGLNPAVSLSGAGAGHVLASYRLCANGSVLIGLLNEDTNAANLTLSAPSLLAGLKVEDLSAGGYGRHIRPNLDCSANCPAPRSARRSTGSPRRQSWQN